MSDRKSDAAVKDSSGKTNYHSGFLSGLEVLLWPYREKITLMPEQRLSAEGIRMDILLLKKDPALEIQFDIARAFKEHNVIEYKRSGDSLNIDVFSKVMAYAYLYKSQSALVDAIPFQNLSATIYRHIYPRAAFRQLESNGASIERAYPGVYYINNMAPFAIQILVGRELSPDEYSMFRVLLPNAFDDDIRRFKNIALQIHDADYQKSVDNIFQVSVSLNRETYARLRKEEPDMCEALRELMKDEFDELDKAREEANQRAIKAEMERDEATKERDEAARKYDEAIRECYTLRQKISELEKHYQRFSTQDAT